jgi:homoserine dehydrogenase
VDRPGVLATVAGVFGAHGVSIASMEQEGPSPDPTLVPAGATARLDLITHLAGERALQATIDELRGLDVVHRVGSVIRVLGDEGAEQ